MLIAQTSRQAETSHLLPQLHEWSDSLLMLLVVAVGNIAFFVFKTAVPAGIGVLLAHFNQSFPYRMRHEEFLCHQSAARQGVGVYVTVIILIAQFLLLVAVALVTIGIVGIEVNSELSYLTRVVEIHLVLGHTFCSFDATVLQVVIRRAVSLQIIVILKRHFHIVVGVLIETAKRVMLVQLIVEAETTLKEWIAYMLFLFVGNNPQCIGKDGLFKLTATPLLVIGSEKVGE